VILWASPLNPLLKNVFGSVFSVTGDGTISKTKQKYFLSQSKQSYFIYVVVVSRVGIKKHT